MVSWKFSYSQSQFRQSMDWYVAIAVEESLVDNSMEHIAYCKIYHICFNQVAAELVHGLERSLLS
jgi:hypothetical protein